MADVVFIQEPLNYSSQKIGITNSSKTLIFVAPEGKAWTSIYVGNHINVLHLLKVLLQRCDSSAVDIYEYLEEAVRSVSLPQLTIHLTDEPLPTKTLICH
jgi:hypothetical protein